MAYIDQYGVRFSDDKKVLEKCPKDFKGAYTIPNSVTTIGKWAFAECRGLTSIEIPNSVTEIGEDSFRGCIGLTSIEIPNSVTKIGHYAFQDCAGLTSINIPNSIAEIGISVFRGCANMPIIDNIRYADTYLIEAADKSLKTYTIKEGTKFIENNAFEGCYGLTSIEIPNSVTKIEFETFQSCINLTSIIIPNSVTEIGWRAFQDCTGLTSIKIPNSVTSINVGVFAGCTNLTSIKIPNSVTRIGGGDFRGCIGLVSVTIPNSVTTIGDSAFQGCSSLTSIEIPNSVTKIMSKAFEDCTGLTSLEIPNSVIEIEHHVFSGCINLREIIVPFGQKERFSKMVGLRGLEDKIIERDHEKITILLNLAKAYEKGIGVQQDRGQAFLFYKQAAEAGSKEAQQWMQEREQEEQQMRDFMEETKNEVHQQSYYLFFDTETTGTPRYYSAPVSDSDNWPRLVQVGWIVTDQDGEVVKRRNYIIRPQGFTIPIEASNVHHITTEKALQLGTELKPVLQEFYQDVVEAEHLVGHNIDFDQHIVGAELYRNNMNSSALMNKRCTCTMHSSTNFCAIPSTNGYADYKWPKLQELYYKLFGRNFEEAHDAMADITATKECFFELKKRGII